MAKTLDTSGDRDTLLHKAIKYGVHDCVMVLIENGCDLREKDSYGYMAIHWAARNNQKQAVEMMLSHNSALINATTSNNQTPIFWAAKENQRDVVEFLLRQPSIDVRIKDRYGIRPEDCTTDEEIKRMIKNSRK